MIDVDEIEENPIQMVEVMIDRYELGIQHRSRSSDPQIILSHNAGRLTFRKGSRGIFTQTVSIDFGIPAKDLVVVYVDHWNLPQKFV